jgi:hypothetical protein
MVADGCFGVASRLPPNGLMPPLTYVKRIPGLNYDALKPAYTDLSVWDSFDPATLTLCSPRRSASMLPRARSNCR